MSVARGGTPRLLHLHGSLAKGDPQAERCVRLIAAFGARLRHTLVAADGDYGALDALPNGLSIARDERFPRFAGVPTPGRLQAVARAMRDYDLVLSYGRAAIGAALSHTAFGEIVSAPPLVHHEDGSDETAAQRRGWRSKWLRRVGLGRAAGLVVPTEVMEEAGLVDWQQPLGRVKLIADGVDLAPRGRSAKTQGIGRLLKRGGENWIGFVGASGDDAELAGLGAQVAGLDESWHLVVMNTSPSGPVTSEAIKRHALDHRIHFVGVDYDRRAALAHCDIVVAASGREPLPLCVIEAAAAGKPLANLPHGTATEVLAPENLASDNDQIERLAGDAYLRESIGKANLDRIREERDEARMIASYRRLYASAMGRNSF